MDLSNLKKQLTSPGTWRKVQFYSRYKSTEEFNGKLPKEDFLPITITLLLASIIIVLAVGIAIIVAF